MVLRLVFVPFLGEVVNQKQKPSHMYFHLTGLFFVVVVVVICCMCAP